MYNIGGNNEWANIDVVNLLCRILDKRFLENSQLTKRYSRSPCARGIPANSLITHVGDRLGHDTRYAVNPDKVASELGFRPLDSFESGLNKTVDWYLANESWWKAILDGSYRI